MCIRDRLYVNKETVKEFNLLYQSFDYQFNKVNNQEERFNINIDVYKRQVNNSDGL